MQFLIYDYSQFSDILNTKTILYLHAWFMQKHSVLQITIALSKLQQRKTFVV